MRYQRFKSARRPAHVSRCGRSRLSLDTQSLRFESLEDRRLLAITVDTVLDVVDTADNLTSLREAIATTNTTNEGAINFAVTGAINLVSGELEITDTLTITGPGQELLTIDAQQQSRVLNFSAITGDLILSNLTLTGGQSTDSGGIRFNSDGALTLTNSTISGNTSGGIFSDSGRVSLTSSTVSGNGSPSTGSGISTDSGNVSLMSSRVTGNMSYSTGGGIFTVSGDVSLTSSAVNGNSTTGYWRYGGGAGGGIYTRSGSVSLTSSTVDGNSTSGRYAHGGGIATSSGSVSLTGSTVSGNSTAGISAPGGGISSSGLGSVSLTSSTVSGNSSGDAGGGIHTNSSSVLLTSSMVSGNSTSGRFGSGGGISTGTGHVSLTSSTVSGNSTSGLFAVGGGISMRSGTGSVSLTSSTVSGNVSYSSGGGISTSYGSGILSLMSSTVSGNSTSGTDSGGGGIFTGFRTVSLSNSTVSGNAASANGGGINIQNTFFSPSLTIENTIVAGNTAGITAPDLLPDPDGTLTINHSLIGVADGLIIAGNAGNLTGTAANPLDPLIGPIANNGGTTHTHALLPGSPAFNAGNPSFDPNVLTPPRVNDQRGFAFDRVVGGRIDIGSVETGATSADFDSNGNVDGADFLTWQRGFGTAPVTNSDGDANIDGAVNTTDLLLWSEEFGQSSAAALLGGTSATGSESFETGSIETGSFETGFSTFEVANTELIDAALALELLGSARDEELEFVTDLAILQATFGASSELIPSAHESTASELFEYDFATPSVDTTNYADQPWLAEELVERVFE